MDGLSDGWPKAMTDALYYKYYYHISPLLAGLLLMGLMMNYKALFTVIRNLEGVICYAFVNCMMFNAVFQRTSVISRWKVHLSMLPRVPFYLNFLSKPLASFPHDHRRNNGNW